MKVKILKILPTGCRYVPKHVIGKIGTVVKSVNHHNRWWYRVCFDLPNGMAVVSPGDRIFGKPYYDFLPEEIWVMDTNVEHENSTPDIQVSRGEVLPPQVDNQPLSKELHELQIHRRMWRCGLRASKQGIINP